MTGAYEMRHVQCRDGLYLHAEDVVASLRGRVTESLRLAEEASMDEVAAAWWAVAEAFRVHADMLDVAVIGCVTEEPSPWTKRARDR